MHEANISYYSTGAAFATSTQAVQDQIAYKDRIYPHNAATLSQLLTLHRALTKALSDTQSALLLQARGKNAAAMPDAAHVRQHNICALPGLTTSIRCSILCSGVLQGTQHTPEAQAI